MTTIDCAPVCTQSGFETLQHRTLVRAPFLLATHSLDPRWPIMAGAASDW